MLTQRKSWLSLAAAAAAAVLRVAVPRFWDPLLLQHLLQVLLQVLLVWHCCCCTCSSPWKGTPSDTHCIPAAADRALATWACLHPACVPPTLQCLRCPTLQACQIPTGSIQSLCTPSCIQSLGSCVPRLQGRIQHTVPSRSHNVKCCTCRDVPPSVCPALAKRAVSDSSQQGPKLAPASIPVQATTTECITSSHDLTTHSCLCAAALHAALGTQSASTAQGQLLHLPAQHAASCCHRGDQLYRPVQCCS
jgi:hypothetical protein